MSNSSEKHGCAILLDSGSKKGIEEGEKGRMTAFTA